MIVSFIFRSILMVVRYTLVGTPLVGVIHAIGDAADLVEVYGAIIFLIWS